LVVEAGKLNDIGAHRMLTEVQRYFYRTRLSRVCKCGCGKRLSLENYWKHPTVYKKVPEFLTGHNHRGERQTPEHVARRAVAISRTLRKKRETGLL
jgi:hypothetical protein